MDKKVVRYYTMIDVAFEEPALSAALNRLHENASLHGCTLELSSSDGGAGWPEFKLAGSRESVIAYLNAHDYDLECHPLSCDNYVCARCCAEGSWNNFFSGTVGRRGCDHTLKVKIA